MNPFSKRLADTWSVLTGKNEARMQGSSLPYGVAQITLTDLQKYLEFTGQTWPHSFYTLTIDGKKAIDIPTFTRCVTLTSGLAARLLTKAITIRDEKGQLKTDRRAMKVMEFLRESWDGRRRPAYQQWEDAVADYCMDGNGLIYVEPMSDTMQPNRLIRMTAQSGSVREASGRMGNRVYDVIEADRDNAQHQKVSELQMIHMRWPLMTKQLNRLRLGFGPSPVQLVRPALTMFAEIDRYILHTVKNPEARFHFDQPRLIQAGGQMLKLSSGKIEVIQSDVKNAFSEGDSVITSGVTSSSLYDILGEEQIRHKEFMIADIARLFGVPSPLYGVDLQRWADAIEQLSKMYWKYSFSIHMDRLLKPMELRLLRRGESFHVDTMELLRGDSTAMAEQVNAGLGAGNRYPIISQEEGRQMLGLPREVDGEVVKPLEKMTGGGNNAEGSQ